MKTVLITGATDGIGKATAFRLLTQDWNVVLVGRNQKKVESTINELNTLTGNQNISGITADLSLMQDVRNAVSEFLKSNKRLDVLILNANAISNERKITPEGHEINLAVGYMSRVLMIQLLAEVLAKTQNSQIFSIMGKSWVRPDFNDMNLDNNFSGWKALTHWQWSMALYLKEYAKRSSILTNIYSPGLVKTKILANEPQPMRTMVKIMNKIIGISTEKAAQNVAACIQEITDKQTSGHFFEWAKDKGVIRLQFQEGDFSKLLQAGQI